MGLRGFGVFVLSVILFVVLTLGMIAGSLNVFLSAGVYQDAFEEANVYSFVEKQFIGNELGLNFVKGGVKGAVDSTLEQVLDYINGDTNEIVLIIDGNEIKKFFEQEVTKFPVCTEEESAYVGGEVKCRPASLNSSQFLEQVLVEENIKIVESQEVDLLEVFDKEKNIDKLRNGVSYYKFGLWALPIIAVILVLLVFYISGESKRMALFFSGGALIFSGLIGIFGGSYFENFLLGKMNGLEGSISALVQSLLDSFVARLLVIGFMLGVIGILFYLAGFVASPKKK
ncbi:MAG: hypothetical protein AABW80_01805 [Nanoarchaeota archaeon]